MPEHAHAAGARVGQAEQHADHRRLAGAVGTEEAERAAARHLQVDAVDRGALAEALGQAGGLDRAGLRSSACLVLSTSLRGLNRWLGMAAGSCLRWRCASSGKARAQSSLSAEPKDSGENPLAAACTRVGTLPARRAPS